MYLVNVRETNIWRRFTLQADVEILDGDVDSDRVHLEVDTQMAIDSKTDGISIFQGLYEVNGHQDGPTVFVLELVSIVKVDRPHKRSLRGAGLFVCTGLC